MIYSPPRDQSIAALKHARDAGDASEAFPDWSVASNRRETVETLISIGALGVLYSTEDALAFDYLGFFPASA